MKEVIEMLEKEIIIASHYNGRVSFSASEAQSIVDALREREKEEETCDHDRHYSEIDGFAYCNKCGTPIP